MIFAFRKKQKKGENERREKKAGKADKKLRGLLQIGGTMDEQSRVFLLKYKPGVRFLLKQ